MQFHSGQVVNPKAGGNRYWNLLNFTFAVFIFFAIAYPMPTESKVGFLSPFLVGILGFILTLNFFKYKTVVYWNKYVLKICVVFSFLIVSDFVTALFINPTQQLLYTAARIATVLIFLAGLSFFPSLTNFFRIIKIYLWSIILLSLLTIAEGISLVKAGSFIRRPRSFFGVTLPFRKAVGFNMSDGEFGIMVAPAFLFLLIQFFPKNGLKLNKGRTLMILIVGMALLISQSRSMWFGLILSVGTSVFMLAKSKHRKILFISASVLLIILLITNVYSYLLKGLMGEGAYKRNISNRLNSYFAGWNYFTKSPVIGVGHGHAFYTIPDRNRNILIHNQIIDQLASTGILGVIPLLALYVIFLRTSLKLYREAKEPVHRGLAIWMTASMVHILTELMLYRGFYSEHLPWYFALLGILYSIQYGYREVVLKDTDKTSQPDLILPVR